MIITSILQYKNVLILRKLIKWFSASWKRDWLLSVTVNKSGSVYRFKNNAYIKVKKRIFNLKHLLLDINIYYIIIPYRYNPRSLYTRIQPCRNRCMKFLSQNMYSRRDKVMSHNCCLLNNINEHYYWRVLLKI